MEREAACIDRYAVVRSQNKGDGTEQEEGRKGFSEWSGAKSWQSICIILMHYDIVISCQEVTKSGLPSSATLVRTIYRLGQGFMRPQEILSCNLPVKEQLMLKAGCSRIKF